MCDERELIVKVEQIVVNGRGCQEDDLFSAAIPAAASICTQQKFKICVRLGVAVPEVVRLINQHNIRISPGRWVELFAAQFFLRQDGSRDRGVRQLVLPDLPQAGRTNDQCLLPEVVGKILQELFANPCFPKTHRIGNHDAIVTSQDFSCLFDRILLNFRKLDCGSRRPWLFGFEFLPEISV